MSPDSNILKERLRIFENACRAHGLKITPQRIAIYKELSASTEHPSAVAIFNQVRKYQSNISLDTVNRTLRTFHEIGLAKVVENSGDPKRFDPNLRPHHHFRCLKCGKVDDFTNKDYDALTVPKKIAEKYVVVETRVHLEGYCEECDNLR